jgi:hypothetical protein
MAVLKKGTSGELVKRLQTKLGVETDQQLRNRGQESPASQNPSKRKNSGQRIGLSGSEVFCAEVGTATAAVSAWTSFPHRRDSTAAVRALRSRRPPVIGTVFTVRRHEE